MLNIATYFLCTSFSVSLLYHFINPSLPCIVLAIIIPSERMIFLSSFPRPFFPGGRVFSTLAALNRLPLAALRPKPVY